jgi:hypothetical protein
MRVVRIRARPGRRCRPSALRQGPRASLRLLAKRVGLLSCLAGSLLGLGATSASAVVLQLPGGHRISYRPLNGAPSFARSRRAAGVRELEYHGGPIMPANYNYAFYWAPATAPAYPAGYQSGVNKYFSDLSHDSGGVQNVDSVATQYGDSAGEFANYSSHFVEAIIDTDPYPANGCAAATICLTDAQLQAELSKYVIAHKLPHDLTHDYFILTPPGVENCAEETACSAGSALPVYCAYHSFIPLAGGSIIYSSDPYVTGNSGCDDGEHPNNKPSDGALQGGLSHEHNESITDPEINAWFDSRGEENGDKCRTFVESSEYGPPLGTAPDGSRFNQVIDGDPYWYQQEWSNAGSKCKQRLSPEPPSVRRLAPRKGPSAGGTAVTITGALFTGATAVRFGASNALGFSVTGPGTIQAISPPEPRGTLVDVTVTTPVGTSAATRKDHFKYAR